MAIQESSTQPLGGQVAIVTGAGRGLGHAFAIALAKDGIAVFAIHPGTVNTPMNDFHRTAEIVGRRAPELQQPFRKLHEEDAFHPIEQSVALILFLASGKADALSGRFISVDDDLQERVCHSEEIERAGLYTLQLHKLDE